MDDWALHHAEQIVNQVYVRGRDPNDEGLWVEFVQDFERHLKDTAAQQRAEHKLQSGLK